MLKISVQEEILLEILNISRVPSNFHPINILIRKMNTFALEAKYGWCQWMLSLLSKNGNIDSFWNRRTVWRENNVLWSNVYLEEKKSRGGEEKEREKFPLSFKPRDPFNSQQTRREEDPDETLSSTSHHVPCWSGGLMCGVRVNLAAPHAPCALKEPLEWGREALLPAVQPHQDETELKDGTLSFTNC